jgi:hypothetical protein
MLRAQLKTALAMLRRGVIGKYDLDRSEGVATLLQRLQHIEPCPGGQDYVEQDQVWLERALLLCPTSSAPADSTALESKRRMIGESSTM